QVVGYGEKGERWVIDRFEITQSLRYDNNGECRRIDPGSYPEDWQVLITDVLEKTYPLQHYPHHEMGIMMLGVDSGGEDGV
ncbi:terminase gpA endonuclease subunit, partial [Escherichia coli]